MGRTSDRRPGRVAGLLARAEEFPGHQEPAPLVRARAIPLGRHLPDSAVVPSLFDSLDDKDQVVRLAAITELKNRTGQDFGYHPLRRARGTRAGRREVEVLVGHTAGGPGGWPIPPGSFAIDSAAPGHGSRTRSSKNASPGGHGRPSMNISAPLARPVLRPGILGWPVRLLSDLGGIAILAVKAIGSPVAGGNGAIPLRAPCSDRRPGCWRWASLWRGSCTSRSAPSWRCRRTSARPSPKGPGRSSGIGLIRNVAPCSCRGSSSRD